MTLFQTLTVIIAGLSLLGSIVGLYINTKVSLAKIQIQLDNFRRELDAEKIAHLQNEKFNREDHKEIINKLDNLINNIFNEK